MSCRFFLLCLLFSCGDRNSTVYAIDIDKTRRHDTIFNEVRKYSLAFNRYRFDHHIPALPDSFILNGYGLDYAGWQNENPEMRPVYHNKLIVWSADSLLSERNVFLGVRGERLIIWYGKNEENPVYHFSCGFRQVESDSSTRKDVSPEQADSILRSWGLKP